jgi:hypothetical protein
MRAETKKGNVVTKHLNLATHDYVGSYAIPRSSDKLKKYCLLQVWVIYQWWPYWKLCHRYVFNPWRALLAHRHDLFHKPRMTLEWTSNDVFLFRVSSLGAAETRSGHIGDEFFWARHVYRLFMTIFLFCYQWHRGYKPIPSSSWERPDHICLAPFHLKNQDLIPLDLDGTPVPLRGSF